MRNPEPRALRVVITGMGAISPLGESIAEYLSALQSGRSGITQWQRTDGRGFSKIGGEMVAAVSHEVRTPLGIISSTAELLKRKLTRTDPQDQLADVIVQEANRLNRVVTDFLDFARPSAPHLMPCNVAEVLEKNEELLLAWDGKGQAEVQIGEHGESLKSFDRAVRIARDHHVSLNWRQCRF